jgi:hypothetical protein
MAASWPTVNVNLISPSPNRWLSYVYATIKYNLLISIIRGLNFALHELTFLFRQRKRVEYSFQSADVSRMYVEQNISFADNERKHNAP